MPVLRKSRTGSWVTRIALPPTPTGKRQQLRLHAPTKSALSVKVAAALADADRYGPPPRARTTLAELLDRWLEKKAHEVEFRTIEGYREQVRLYLKPRFGTKIVHQLTTADVQAAIDDWQREPRLDKKAGKRSARTVNYPITVLSSVLTYARALGLCRDNVVHYVQRPRKEYRPPPVADAERAVAILQAFLGTDVFAPTWIAFANGLRRSEIVGLRRRDVDLCKSLLNIERAVVCRRRKMVVKATKRKRSDRSLPLSEITTRVLAYHMDDQAARLAVLSVSCDGETPLFDDGAGQLWHPDTFASAYARELSRNSSGWLRLHGTRHSFASIALDEGVQLRIISDVLGHEKESFTAEHYTHVFPKALRDGINRVSEALLARFRQIGSALPPAE